MKQTLLVALCVALVSFSSWNAKDAKGAKGTTYKSHFAA